MTRTERRRDGDGHAVDRQHADASGLVVKIANDGVDHDRLGGGGHTLQDASGDQHLDRLGERAGETEEHEGRHAEQG